MPERIVRTETILDCNNCGSTAQAEVGGGPDFEYDTCDNEFVFVRCGDCGLVYLKNRPTIDELGVIYPAAYIPHHFEEHLGGFIASLRARVQRMKTAAMKPYAAANDLIMDVGPGNGEFLGLLKTYGDPSWRLTGVDFSDEAIAAVQARGIDCVKARFEALQWDGPAPAVISMNQVIEHLDDPASAVAKAYELLRPGGVLFMETPSIDGLDYHLFKRRYWGGWHTPRHWVLYDEETLSSLVRSKGFEVAEITYLLSPNFWLQSVHHWMLERGATKLAKRSDVSFFPALAAASALDLAQRFVRGRTSNFRLVARKPTA